MGLDFRGLCPMLAVFDMPASLRFYRDVLGFSEVAKSGEGDEVGWAWLRRGADDLMLNTAFDAGERPEALADDRRSAHRDTILYFGCEDLDGAYAYLLSRGVEAQPPEVAPYGMNQLYLKDPDGYGLCLQCRAEGVGRG